MSIQSITKGQLNQYQERQLIHKRYFCKKTIFRPEVLDKRSVADEVVKVVNVAREVNVEKQIVFHLFQQLQTFSVFRLVKAENHLFKI